MRKVQMENKCKLVIFLLLIMTGFTFAQVQDTTRSDVKAIPDNLDFYYWPGLDFKVIKKADSLFLTANVTELNEKIGNEYYKQAMEMSNLCDSLWNFKVNEEKTGEDSTRALFWFQQAIDYIKTAPYEANQLLKQAKRYGKLDTTLLGEIVTALIPQVNKTFYNAIRYNPLNTDFRANFAKFLQSSYNKIKDVSLLDQGIEQLKYARKQKPGILNFYNLLAQLYELRKEWQLAYENYKTTADLLARFAIFKVPDPENYFENLEAVPFDTSNYVALLYKQADCKIHLYEAAPALSILKRARKLSPDSTFKAACKNRIDWINWDDGNIRASEIRDEAIQLTDKKRYDEAKLRFISLLDTLWTQRTKDEINFRIALLDYRYLNNENDALARLFKVIKRTKIDSLTGTAVDSAHQQYFNAFGSWCYETGQKYLKLDLTYAYLYFCQAAQIECIAKPISLIQLAILSDFDAQESIDLCNQALKYEDELDETSKTSLYRQLYWSYRKLGNFAEARKWFDKANNH